MLPLPLETQSSLSNSLKKTLQQFVKVSDSVKSKEKSGQWPAVIVAGRDDRPKRSYITPGTVIETPG